MDIQPAMINKEKQMSERKYAGKDGDGNEVYVGDEIGWKDDHEKSGTVIGSKGSEFKVEVYDDITCQTETEWVWKDRSWLE